MDGKKIKVLIVDDDKSVRDFLSRLLKLNRIEALTAEDGLQAIELAKKEKIDLVFMDIRMPRMNGLQVFTELKKSNTDLSCIFMTGYAIEASLLDSMSNFPATVCLKKPFENITFINEMVNKIQLGEAISPKNKETFNDRRAFIRLDIVLEVDYKLKENPGPFIQSFSKNIAPNGVKLLIKENLPVGSIIDMVLRITNSDSSCKATGKVAWICASSNNPGYYETGVEILEVDFSEFANFLIETGKLNFSSKLPGA